MLRSPVLLALGVCLGCQPGGVVGYGELSSESPPPAVYETVELSFEAGSVDGNPFTKYARLVFSHETERYEVDGFYDGQDEDGDHVWRARFMPTRPGLWRYAWEMPQGTRGGSRQRGSGDLSVRERRDPDNHGHVRVDPTTPHVLLYDDGKAHYFIGGKWFSAKNYGPPSKDGEANNRVENGSNHDAHLTDQHLSAYVDELKLLSHNGALLKIGYYPLLNDGLSWDLEWIRRADRWLKTMQRHNIYCQINLFDPWSRTEQSWFQYSEDPTEHVINAWSASDEAEKENYIRYIVARFAGFSNVYWELVNRIDQPGQEAGDVFVEQANTKYLPWLQAYDPYDLPIGGSDVARVRQMPDLDIEFPRDTSRPHTSDSRRSVVLNELVHACRNPGKLPEPAYADSMIRLPVNRLCYRSVFWRAFVLGAFGTNEASWLDLTKPLNDAVLNVMRDHQALHEFIESLPLGPAELVHNPGFVEAATAHVGTRAKQGQLYVSYFNGRSTAEQIQVRLPPGQYRYRWLEPTLAGALQDWESIINVAEGATTLTRPGFNEDLVLLVEKAPTSPK